MFCASSLKMVSLALMEKIVSFRIIGESSRIKEMERAMAKVKAEAKVKAAKEEAAEAEEADRESQAVAPRDRSPTQAAIIPHGQTGASQPV